jgi:hypothetical protein
MPDRVNVPEPVFTSASRPDPLMSVPVNVVEVELPPVVRVWVTVSPSWTVPAPASEPIVWSNSPISSVAPAATVKALADEKALVAPPFSVPALTLVAPE